MYANYSTIDKFQGSGGKVSCKLRLKYVFYRLVFDSFLWIMFLAAACVKVAISK